MDTAASPASHRPALARRLIPLAALVLACVAAFWLKTGFSKPARETVRLWAPPDALNLGTVWETDQLEWTLPVENREEAPVEVESFSTTCNCLSVEPQSFVLEPGARRDLRLQIDLGSQLKTTGEVNIQLVPQLKESGEGNQAKKLSPDWRITGQVRRALTFDRNVYLGRHSELSQPLEPWTIPVEVLVPLESLTAECDVPGLAASLERHDGGKASLRLTPLLPFPVGELKGTVNLKPVLNGGERLPAPIMRFAGKIVPDVEAVPPAIQVGGRRLGEAFEDVVVLRSLTGRAFTAVRADVEGDGLAVASIEGSGRIRIRQKVCQAGSQSNRVLVHVHSEGREVAILVPVSYTGLELD